MDNVARDEMNETVEKILDVSRELTYLNLNSEIL